jgi:hypothetical protein
MQFYDVIKVEQKQVNNSTVTHYILTNKYTEASVNCSENAVEDVKDGITKLLQARKYNPDDYTSLQRQKIEKLFCEASIFQAENSRLWGENKGAATRYELSNLKTQILVNSINLYLEGMFL